MFLLKTTGVALLVAQAMALSCDDLLGTHHQGFDQEVIHTAGGCGSSWCKDPWGKDISRNTQEWGAAKYQCEDVGMRLCTMQELRDGYALGTGCGFDFKEVWSSDECEWGRSTFNSQAANPEQCRSETGAAETQHVRCCANFLPPPTAETISSAPVHIQMVKCLGDRYQCNSQTDAEKACRYHDARLCSKSEVQGMGSFCTAGYMSDGVGWYMSTEVQYCGSAGWNTRNAGAPANAFCCGAVTPEPTSAPTTAQPTAAPTAQPTAAPTAQPTAAPDLSGDSLSKGGASDWQMGRVADDVYKCNGSQCFVNSKEKRGSFDITTAPEDLSLIAADFFDDFTSDGHWYVQDDKLTFSDGANQNTFPFGCACEPQK